MCKYFSRYRQKRNWPVATALRLRSFALVESLEWDDNAFFHSAGTLSVDHTLVMTLCKASLIGFSAPFRSSAVMPSAPAAPPFFNRSGYFMQHRYIFRDCYIWSGRICEIIKISWGSNIWMVESVLVMFFPAFCNFGWCVAQATVWAGNGAICNILRVLPRRRFIARYAGLRLFFRKPDSASSANFP